MEIWGVDKIASDAKRQKYIIGMGEVADEMALDFDCYFSGSYEQFVGNGLLTDQIYEELLLIDKFFDERSGDKSTNFWDDDLLETNEDWVIARQKVKSILLLMGMDNLDLNVFTII